MRNHQVGEKEMTDMLLTVSELSSYTGMSRSWIYLAVERKKVPHIRLDTATRFIKWEIDEWLASKQIAVTVR